MPKVWILGRHVRGRVVFQTGLGILRCRIGDHDDVWMKFVENLSDTLLLDPSLGRTELLLIKSASKFLLQFFY